MLKQKTINCEEQVWERAKVLANKEGMKLAKWMELSILERVERTEQKHKDNKNKVD